MEVFLLAGRVLVGIVVRLCLPIVIYQVTYKLRSGMNQFSPSFYVVFLYSQCGFVAMFGGVAT